MRDEKTNPQGSQIIEAADPLGLRGSIESAKKILEARKGKKLSPKITQEAATFAQSLGLDGGSLNKALATLEKHREEMDIFGENNGQSMADGRYDAAITNKQSSSVIHTSIVIDDHLMSQALELSGLKTMKETVEEALKLLIATKQQESIR